VIRALVGATVTAVVLAACGQTTTSHDAQDPGSAPSSRTTDPALVGTSGGTVTMALDQVPVNLNDHTVAGDTPETQMVASAIWPQVFQMGPDYTPVLDTNVVQSAELVSTSPQTVVYQINPKATWSDGTPISANDFIYAWESQRGDGLDVDGSPDSVVSTLGYRDITSVTGSNNGKTVTVVFRSPFGDWESLFDDLLPADVAQQVGWNQGFATFNPANLVSGGPWVVESWEPGVQIVLTRNPHWWGSAPRLDRIVIDAPSNQNDLVEMLGAGKAQVAYPSSFDESLLADLSSSPTLQTNESLGTNMLQLVFNTRHSPFDNVSVRQGVAHEIDRAGIVSNLVSPLDQSVWIDNDHLFSNAQPQYSENGSNYVQPDPTTASRLLQQGGLALVNGTWTYHHAPVVIQLAWAYDDPWSALIAPAIASELTQAGFGVSSSPVSSSELSGSVLPGGDFDLALVPIPASMYPTATAQYFTSAPNLTNPGTDLNWSGFSDSALDNLLTMASQQLGSNVADPMYVQADQELWAQMPTLPLFAEPTLLVNSASVMGVQDDPGGLGPMYTATSWFLLGPAHTKSSQT
jgi:peptide/nickel transport system substrate-binding protein